MINIAVNKAHKNSLKTMWVDVKKAFDSVDHPYLIECVKKLNLPKWIEELLSRTISNSV